MAIFYHLAEVLDMLDNNVEICCRVLHDPASKIPLVYDIFDNKMPGDNDFWSPDRVRDNTKHSFLFDKLDQEAQEKAWALHDCHFHPDIYAYMNCPYTSLCELAELARHTYKKWPNL